MVAVSGFLVALVSERVFWFYGLGWFGAGVLGTIELAVFYGLAVMVGIWVLAAIPAPAAHHAVLAGSAFALVVEGVITPVIYEGGLWDVRLPLLFVGWHGVFAFAIGWFLVRRWLLARRTGRLLVASTVAGLAWGLWAPTAWLPDSDQVLEAGGPESVVPAVVGPGEFAGYAMAVVIAMGVAHWLLDRVWPHGYRPGWRSALVPAALFVPWFVAQAIAVPVAIPKMAIMAGILIVAVAPAIRGRTGAPLFAPADRRVRLVHTFALLPAGIAAGGLYALAWWVDPTAAVLEAVREWGVRAIIWAGGLAFAWAVWRVVADRR